MLSLSISCSTILLLSAINPYFSFSTSGKLHHLFPINFAFSENLILRNKENVDAHKLMIEGILMIWQKRHPLDVKDLLTAHITPDERKQFEDDE